jgi:hypothetical protein
MKWLVWIIEFKPPNICGLQTVWSLLPAKLIVIIFPFNITFNDNNSKLSQCKSASRPTRHNSTITAVRYFAGTPAIYVHVRPTLFIFSLQNYLNIIFTFYCQFSSGSRVPQVDLHMNFSYTIQFTNFVIIKRVRRADHFSRGVLNFCVLVCDQI